jgi:uncharacterized protein YegJ (DUF2314 family)
MHAVDPFLGRSVVMIMARLCAVVVGTLGALTIGGTLMMGGPGLASPTMTETARRGEAVLTPRGNPAMRQAFARARSELDGFLKSARNPGSDEQGFAVKIPVRQGGHTEYFWITPFRENRNRFEGTVSNRPTYVRNVKHGQTVVFNRSDIVDWMYLKGSAMYGNYTTCALMAGRPAAEAAEFRSQYGLHC